MDAARLEALGTDAWSLLLAAAKQAAAGRPEGRSPGLDLVRTTSSARLAGGRARVRAATLLADPDAWPDVASRLAGLLEQAAPPAADDQAGRPGAVDAGTPQRHAAGGAGAIDPALADELGALLSDARPPAAPVEPGTAASGDGRARAGGLREHRGPQVGAASAASAASAADAADELTRVRERLRAAREERDSWRRRAEGAHAQLEQRDAALAAVRDERDAARQEIDRLQASLGQAADERARAVARERRRQDGERAQLEEALREARRGLEEERAARRRAVDEARADERRRPRGTTSTPETSRPERLVPGRPSVLPAGVVPGTTEAAQLLLHRGRQVLVDGYNVSQQHQPGLDLEGQRRWLLGTLAGLAARRGVRPTVIFDGEQASGARPRGGSREVRVRFTDAGITADDEIVLAVEATDEPIVVVTDDRELGMRVRAAGADVLDTRSFLGAAS